MAYKTIRISDISGKEGKDEDFLTVVIRSHPFIQEPVKIDVFPEEIKSLNDSKDMVVLDIQQSDKETTRLIVPVEEFNSIAPNIKEVLERADGVRGRRRGYSPTATKA